MSDRRERIEDAFADALELPAAERDALLRERFADDPAALAEVTSLLGYANAPTQRTNGAGLRAVIEAALRSFAAPHVGARLGPYRLIELIGQGGMGTVYLAERDDERFERTVAIKILQHELSSPDVVARFRDERHILAALDHPGIVRLLDGGETDDGLPYLVMEHVDGVPLARHADGLTIRDRVALVIRIASALQYAHQKLIVHRDVKPGNILVDHNGAPKLLDFGIAKLVADEADHERRTRTGMAVFTPEYASPEQARGGAINVATDVYSLGAVLYELLTRRPPQRAGASPLETLRRICDDEPARASIVAPREVKRQIAGDLDNIVARALQKKPELRYPSVAEFADDLQRHLDGMPVRAREASFVYRTRKLVRRHVGKLVLASAIAAALLTATIISVRNARRADRQRRDLILLQGWQELRNGHAGRALPYLVEALALGDDSPGTRFMIAEASRPYLNVKRRLSFPDGVHTVGWFPDGKRFFVCHSKGAITIHDRNGDQLAELAGIEPGNCQLDPTGAWLVSFSGEGVVAWETVGFRRSLELNRRAATRIAMSRTGRLVRASAKGELYAIDLPTGASRELPWRGEIVSIDVTPDGRRLAVASGDSAQLAIFDLDSGTRLPPVPAPGVMLSIHMLRDGSYLSAFAQGASRIWGGAGPDVVFPTSNALMAISDDERRVVTTGDDRGVRVWDRRSGALARELLSPSVRIWYSAKLSHDGARALARTADAFAVWNVDTGELELELEVGIVSAGGVGATEPHFSPDGRELLLPSASDVRIVATGQPARLATHERPDYYMAAVAVSPTDPDVVAIGGRDREPVDGKLVSRVELFDTVRGTTRARVSATGDVWSVGFGADGKHLAFNGDTGAHLVDIATMRQRLLDANAGARLEFSPDGRLLATANDRRAWIWRVEDGTPVFVIPHPCVVKGVTWSPDGATLATACSDKRIRTWSTATSLPIAEFATRTVLLNLSFSPDGRELALAGRAGEIEVWSVTGTRRLSLSHQSTPIVSAAWSADGGLLLAADDGGPVHVWDAQKGWLLASRVRPPETLSAVWTRDGGRAFSTHTTGKLTMWDVHRDERSVEELQAFAAEAVQYRVGANGSLELAGDR